jgi:SPP1 gp7 family putative phage head morphogenesis protein
MISKAQTLREGARIIREVNSFERKAITSIRKDLDKITIKARGQLRRKKTQRNFEFPQRVLDVYSTMLLIQYLQGRRRVVLSAKRGTGQAIKLAFEKDELDRLKKILTLSDEELSPLKKQFDTHALETFSQLNEQLNGELVPYINDLLEENKVSPEAQRYNISKLEAKLNSMGFTPQNSYTIENLFRTQSQLAYNAGKWETEQDPVIQELLWGYVYVTMNDDRVRPEHQVLEGVTLPKEHPFWKTAYPPNGWSCRCVAIPIWNNEGARRKSPPRGYVIDEEFAFNPGEVVNSGLINTSFR